MTGTKNKGIQTPGYYKIILTAEAVRRLTHPYDPKMIPTNLDAPMQLSLYISRGNQGTASDSVTFRTKIGHGISPIMNAKIEVVTLLDEKMFHF